MGGDIRLHEEGAERGIEAGGEKVKRDFKDVGAKLAEVGVAGGEGMPVRDEKVALVLVLEGDPVEEGAHVIAEMQLAGRAHAGEDTAAVWLGRGVGHAS